MRTIAVLACVSAVLAGCRDGAPVLSVAVALLPSELPVYRAVVDEYARVAGVRVIVVPQQYADIRRALAAEALGGHGTLDVVELDVYALAASAVAVSAFDDEVFAEAIAAMAPGAVAAGRIDGLRFVPHRVAWQALIYNHAVLGAPPATWEELLAVARAHPGQIGLKGARYEGLTCDVLPFVWQAGGSGADFSDQGARTALQWLASLAPYLHPQSATFKEATIAEAMARGELVLHLNWPFVMSLYASQELAPDTIRSAPLPAGPAGTATVLGGGYLAVPKYAPHRAEALALVRFLVGRAAQARFARELGWFSARGDVAVRDDAGVLGGFVAMHDRARARPERADYPRISRGWQRAFRAVAFDGVAPAAALAAAQRQLREGPP